MNLKIEKSFQNSQFYRNYNNIDFIILQFKKIKDECDSSKNKYKNNLISIINIIEKNKIQKEILKKITSNVSKKIDSNDFEKINKNNIDEIESNSYTKILIEKINIGSNIKKYVKYQKICEIFKKYK